MNGRSVYFFMLAASLALASAAYAGDKKRIYEWRDAKGGYHATDTPPPEGVIIISGQAEQKGHPVEREPSTEVAPTTSKEAPEARKTRLENQLTQAQECERLITHKRELIRQSIIISREHTKAILNDLQTDTQSQARIQAKVRMKLLEAEIAQTDLDLKLNKCD